MIPAPDVSRQRLAFFSPIAVVMIVHLPDGTEKYHPATFMPDRE